MFCNLFLIKHYRPILLFSLTINLLIFFLAAISSSMGLSVCRLVHKNSPLFASFRPRRLKFGMEVKCEYVKVCVCVHATWVWQWGWAIAKRCITSKWIHRLEQDLVERLVMSCNSSFSCLRKQTNSCLRLYAVV